MSPPTNPVRFTSQVWNPPYNTNKFLDFIAPGSIWDAATAFNNIAPNCYTIRTSWTDIDGLVFRPSNGTWYLRYSSTGTTAGFQWGNGTDVPVLKRP